MIATHNNNGFTGLEALLILIVIGILSLTGWFVLKNKHATQTSVPISQTATPDSSSKSENMQPTTTYKLSSSWLLRKSDNVSIRVPDGFTMIATAGETFDFLLPDQPEGNLRYQKGVTAKVVGEPHREFSLGLLVSENSAGLNNYGNQIKTFKTYSGLPVTVKLYQPVVDPDSVSDFTNGASYYKYMVTKGDDYVVVDYSYLNNDNKTVIEEMVSSIAID